MKLLALMLAAFLTLSPSLVLADEPLAQPWKQAYTGSDSTGAHVIGHWRFEPDDVAADSGPHGLAGRLAGAIAAPDGKFGAALESFRGWPLEDKQHALVVADAAALSPSGAFSAEMWIQPKPDLAEASLAYLLDKKYASHSDYQWLLSGPENSGARRVVVNLGFGSDSVSFASEPLEFKPGVWYHMAFTYDGAGTVRFFRDGSTIGAVTRPGRAAVVAGPHGLSLGDRVGSNYGGFPGYLDEVRLCLGALEFSPASVALSAPRRAWIRHEKPPMLRVTVKNLQSDALSGAVLSLSANLHTEPIALPDLPAGASHVQEFPFDTALRPDQYTVRARLEIPGEPRIEREDALTITLVPRPLPHRMPVMMWGIGSPAEFTRELPRLEQLGFTHCLGFGADYDGIWRAGKPIPASSAAQTAAVNGMLDLALAHQFGIAASLEPGYYLKQKDEFQRVDRKGQPYEREDCNAALPQLAEFCENVGVSVAQTYGDHPAFNAALINSEVRDSSQISFSDFDRELYRQAAGRDIPQEVASKGGIPWRMLPDFPSDRVIADDDPILQFYRWWWTVGDGWNGLHTALHRGLKSTGRDDIWTWYDPAIRVPSVGGSGGDVDVLSQWTYTEPSPLRVGYFADEVFAMAAASARPQRVMKMTQLFWYRSSSAPQQPGAKFIGSPFDDHDPDAAYISIAPMHLRGAFWSKVARPIQGLMYHGWSSLVETDGTHAYKYTQPDLQTEFRRLHREILEPLGPTLLQVPDRPSDVAYLNSFAAQVFAQRGSYGYSHDEAYLTLLHAQLQPQVLFEETLLKHGLDAYKVLVLVDCDVLTASVAQQVQRFQQRGGIVIADPNVAPAIRPDIVLPRFARARKAADDKAAILANAAQLRAALDTRYRRPAECSHAEIVTRVRSSGDSDYVFVVNDHREAGTYVGQHGLVLENGLPSSGALQLRRDGGYVYDLVRGQAVSAEVSEGNVTWPVELGPCEGGVYLVTPRAIEQVRVTAPEAVRRRETMNLTITIADGEGSALPGVLPLQLEITDPAGRVAEYSGYYGAAEGQLQVQLHIAANDLPGVWQIRVHDLAAGKRATQFVRVDP